MILNLGYSLNMKGNEFMKKLALILCFAIMTVCLAACSSEPDNSNVSQNSSAVSNSALLKDNKESSSASQTDNSSQSTSSGHTKTEVSTIKESDFSNPVSNVVGKWKLSHYLSDDGTKTDVNVSVEYYIKNDGTFEARVNGNRSTGSYEFDGKTLTITSGVSGAKTIMKYDSKKDIIYEQAEADLAKAIIVRQ